MSIEIEFTKLAICILHEYITEHTDTGIIHLTVLDG